MGGRTGHQPSSASWPPSPLPPPPPKEEPKKEEKKDEKMEPEKPGAGEPEKMQTE